MFFIMSLIIIVLAIIIFFVVGKKFKYSDILLSFLFFILCIYYGSSNDLFVFFFGLLVLIGLFFVSSIVTFYEFRKNRSIQNLLISTFLIIFAPVAGYISYKFYPYSMFYQWALFHPSEFIEAKKEEGFLQEIDAWGFAGTDSSLMLASSQNYDLIVSDDLKLWKIKNNTIG